MSERRFPYPIHPMALLFPPKTEEEMAVTKSNMVCRQEQGLPPIHDPLQLLDDQLLDGRHRQQAWQELAIEGACGGFFANNQPPVTIVTGETLTAWLVVESGNLCHRHLPPDQRVAILLKAAQEFPEVRSRIEAIQIDNERRMKSGQPSLSGTEGSSTAATIGRMAGGASASTVETVKRVQRDAPEDFEKVVTGNVKAKTVVKKMRHKVSQQPRTSPATNKNDSDLTDTNTIGSLNWQKGLQQVVLTVSDNSKVAEIREFFADSTIRPQHKRTDVGQVFMFAGSAADENKLLAFLANMIGVRGAVKLAITLSSPDET